MTMDSENRVMRHALLIVLALAAPLHAESRDADPARGKAAIEGRSFNPPVWTMAGYESLWKQWGVNEKPADYERAVRERYGLHPAPFPNDGLPMGLRKNPKFLGRELSVDCLVCHGGAIMGHSYVGLGNSALDVQAVFEELNAASGIGRKLPFTFSNVRGTSEAGGMGVFLLGLRTPELGIRVSRLELGLDDQMCEDVPAWWLLKKKKTMYHTGTGDARSVRSIMQFMMGSLNTRAVFDREEEAFRDIRAYMLTLQPPKYPFPIDRDLAAKGQAIFEKTCARCHGTYGAKWTYPNRVVKLDEIGTDPVRFHGVGEKFGHYYNQSWFAKEHAGWFSDGYAAVSTNGYQAPPLDGIWATAPYLHNGSVPTVYNLLKSDSRPKMFTRSYGSGNADYDSMKLGWRVEVLEKPASDFLPAIERRKVYDTSQRGRGNMGHTYGDDLSEAERAAVIEYLKTL
jgi:hypothetical protein